jgi:hypothetical protein
LITRTGNKKLAKVDFLGAISLIIAMASLLVGLDRGSNVAWSDLITIACLCLFVPLISIFAIIEMRIASHPFAPRHIFLTRTVLPSYMTNFFCCAGQMATVFYLPPFL